MRNLSVKDLKKNKKKKKGFTLVELIIVIAIMAILSAVAIPKFGEVTKNANITADIATAKNYHGIAAQYIAETPTATGDLTAAVSQRVDGGTSTSSTLQASKTTKNAFTVSLDGNGNIVVKSGTEEVYPNPSGNFVKGGAASSNP